MRVRKQQTNGPLNYRFSEEVENLDSTPKIPRVVVEVGRSPESQRNSHNQGQKDQCNYTNLHFDS